MPKFKEHQPNPKNHYVKKTPDQWKKLQLENELAPPIATPKAASTRKEMERLRKSWIK
jgi:hypothetical protein